MLDRLHAGRVPRGRRDLTRAVDALAERAETGATSPSQRRSPHRRLEQGAPTTAASTARRTARLTGIAYLGIVLCGLVAEFAVRMSLVVTDDATAGAADGAGSPGLFRAGIGADC